MKLHALALVVALPSAFGEAHAFEPAEQQIIDDLVAEIALLKARLDLYAGSEMSAGDMVTLSWLVVSVLAVGFSVRLLRSSL